jgi:hypothetical protein
MDGGGEDTSASDEDEEEGAERRASLYANQLANLASTYRNQGRWTEAETMREQLLEKSQRVSGEKHPTVANRPRSGCYSQVRIIQLRRKQLK